MKDTWFDSETSTNHPPSEKRSSRRESESWTITPRRRSPNRILVQGWMVFSGSYCLLRGKSEKGNRLVIRFRIFWIERARCKWGGCSLSVTPYNYGNTSSKHSNLFHDLHVTSKSTLHVPFPLALCLRFDWTMCHTRLTSRSTKATARVINTLNLE